MFIVLKECSCPLRVAGGKFAAGHSFQLRRRLCGYKHHAPMERSCGFTSES